MMVRFLLFTILISCILSCSSRARLEMEERELPSFQFSQNYTHLIQDIYCGREPIVRFANFKFDKSDTLRITIDLTTSISENKINGDLTLFLDEYELEYASEPVSKQYVETLEVETQSRYPLQFRGRQSLVNILFSNATTRKAIRKDSQKQYWNTLSILIEPEDKDLILTSADIFFSIKTKKCELMIYPSSNQITELKRFLK